MRWRENFRRRWQLRGGTDLEDGQVMPLGDGYDDRLIFALIGKMMLQLHSQHPSLRAHNIVFG